MRTTVVAAPVLLLALLLAGAYPGRSEHRTTDGWLSLTRDPIEVRYREPNDRLAQDVMNKGHDFLADVAGFLQLPPGGPYTIILAQSKEEFIELQPTRSPAPEWAGALTYPHFGVVLLMTPGALRSSGTEYWALLQHEMVHLVMGEAEAKHMIRIPRWLSEGVATHISGEMNLSRLLHLSWAQVTGRTIPFERIAEDFPDDPSMAETAYAQSYLFVKYMMRRFGDDAVARLVSSLREEGELARAVNAEFEVSLAELLDGFDQYARVKATWIPVITSTATVWGVITLLFLYSVAGRRFRDRNTLRRWQEEEDLAEGSLPGDEQADDEERPPTLH